jgi:hypothetical protein
MGRRALWVCIPGQFAYRPFLSYLSDERNTLVSKSLGKAMSPILLAYIGPETILPAASIAAAIGGILLTFMQFLLSPVKKALGVVLGKPASPAQATSGSLEVVSAEGNPTPANTLNGSTP